MVFGETWSVRDRSTGSGDAGKRGFTAPLAALSLPSYWIRIPEMAREITSCWMLGAFEDVVGHAQLSSEWKTMPLELHLLPVPASSRPWKND